MVLPCNLVTVGVELLRAIEIKGTSKIHYCSVDLLLVCLLSAQCLHNELRKCALVIVFYQHCIVAASS